MSGRRKGYEHQGKQGYEWKRAKGRLTAQIIHICLIHEAGFGTQGVVCAG